MKNAKKEELDKKEENEKIIRTNYRSPINKIKKLFFNEKTPEFEELKRLDPNTAKLSQKNAAKIRQREAKKLQRKSRTQQGVESIRRMFNELAKISTKGWLH